MYEKSRHIRHYFLGLGEFGILLNKKGVKKAGFIGFLRGLPKVLKSGALRVKKKRQIRPSFLGLGEFGILFKKKVEKKG